MFLVKTELNLSVLIISPLTCDDELRGLTHDVILSVDQWLMEL